MRFAYAPISHSIFIHIHFQSNTSLQWMRQATQRCVKSAWFKFECIKMQIVPIARACVCVFRWENFPIEYGISIRNLPSNNRQPHRPKESSHRLDVCVFAHKSSATSLPFHTLHYLPYAIHSSVCSCACVYVCLCVWWRNECASLSLAHLHIAQETCYLCSIFFYTFCFVFFFNFLGATCSNDNRTLLRCTNIKYTESMENCMHRRKNR